MRSGISACHRFGHVFLRTAWKSLGFHKSRVQRLTPDEAEAIGRELIDLAARARACAKPKVRLMKQGS